MGALTSCGRCGRELDSNGWCYVCNAGSPAYDLGKMGCGCLMLLIPAAIGYFMLKGIFG